MSNALAIAAVTTTLQNLLYQGIQDELGNGSVTAQPPDKARENQTDNQVNLFLYHTIPNLAWRNQHPQRQSRREESQKPPLALDLYYLVTAYGENDSETQSHRLFGRVISFFHDHHKLLADDIETATRNRLPDSNLHLQIEQVQITPLSLSFEDMSQVWQVLKGQYRLSAAYLVSVILIDSQLPLNVPFPVLSQGYRQGKVVQSQFLPSLLSLSLPNRQPSAQLGDTITLQGENLELETLRIQFKHTRSPHFIELEPLPDRTPKLLTVKLPDADEASVSQWMCGIYTVSLIEGHSQQVTWQSNALSFTVAPRLLRIAPQEASPGDINLSLTCAPALRLRQKAILLWGDRGFPTRKQSTEDSTTTLTCRIPEVQPGTYIVRLRVEGLDSIPVDFSQIPWQFDPQQQVRVIE